MPEPKAPSQTPPLPSLHSLQVFDAAAQRLSFTAAARDLHVTQTAVSHQIRSLEAELGTALFRRMPRKLALTDAGQAGLLACVPEPAQTPEPCRSRAAQPTPRQPCRGLAALVRRTTQAAIPTPAL